MADQEIHNPAPRTLLRVAIGAGGSGLVLGLVIGSFSAAGIVDMTVAGLMLLAAWVIGAIAITASEPIWGLPRRLRIPVIIGTNLGLALLLGLIGLYQYYHLPVPEKRSARLQVAGVTPVKIPLTDRNFFNLQYDNKGPVQALNVATFIGAKLAARTLSEEETNSEMKKVWAKVDGFDAQGPNHSQLQPDGAAIITLPGIEVTDAQLEEIKQNRLLLYAFLAVRYEDESAEGKYYWTLQFCGYFTAAMTYWHNCAPYEVNKVEGRRFKR